MSNFSTKWEFFIKVLIEKGAYKQVLDGLKCTLIIAVCGLLIGVAIGTLIAVVKILPEKLKVAAVFKKAADIYVAFFRGTPMVVQLLLGYYVLLPLLEIRTTPLVACVVIFGLNSGAYVSEIMRSGLLSVDYGQTEAGRALGLSYPLTLMRIVVPQAIKNILPTLGNEFITLVKETSIVSFVGAVDLCTAFKNIGNSNYEYMVPYTVMALVYIVLVLIITVAIRLMEKRLRASDKR
ncbi:MAG: amino acid ABC transporter permease [Oscillospiraceae bacterium]|nr:amino acid ABC transporter permease [Oscillospiraceae bacterium]MDY2678672.1 amino acid ABC transporter permease [Oscillospiraceae bacterium]